jgi:hypothetical protein
MSHLKRVAFRRPLFSRRSTANSSTNIQAGVVQRRSCGSYYPRASEYRARQPIHTKLLPKNLAAPKKAIGRRYLNPDVGVDGGPHCRVAADGATPYSALEDAKILVGINIPGVLLIGRYSGDCNDLNSDVHWQNWYLMLVASRIFRTGSKYDEEFFATAISILGFPYLITASRGTRVIQDVAASSCRSNKAC